MCGPLLRFNVYLDSKKSFFVVVARFADKKEIHGQAQKT